MGLLDDLFKNGNDKLSFTENNIQNNDNIQQQSTNNRFNMMNFKSNNYNGNYNNNNYMQPIINPLQKGYNILGDLDKNEDGSVTPIAESGDKSYISSYTTIINELDNVKDTAKEAVDGLREHIETLKNGNSKGKHQNIINAYSALGNLSGALLNTIKHQESIVTSSHKLDLTRSKELAKMAIDDTQGGTDFGSALATVMNSMNTYRRETGYNPAYDVVQPQGGIVTESPYEPILEADKAQIALIFDPKTNQAMFQAYTSSGEVIPNYGDLPSDDILNDMLIDPAKDYARHKYTGLQYPLYVVNINDSNEDEISSLNDI